MAVEAPVRKKGVRNFREAMTLKELETLPVPVALGPRHRPVPHHTVVKALEDKLTNGALFGVPIVGQKWEVNDDAMRLYGTIELGAPGKLEAQRAALVESRKGEYTGINREKVAEILSRAGLGGAASLTLSVVNSHDQSSSLRVGLAERIFVCNNLAMDTINASRVMRKHTGDDPWEDRIEYLLSQVFAGGEGFLNRIDAMRNSNISDLDAKAFIYDAFTIREDGHWVELPPSHFPRVGEIYFGHKTEDVGGTTRWDLHNAFTRALRDLPLRRQQQGSSMVTELLSRDLLAVEPTNPDLN